MIKEIKKDTKKVPVSGQVQSLTRGLLLLEKISESKFGVALTDLALQVGLANSTTHRLLTTLEKQGFVIQKGDLALWYIGVKAFTVGSTFFRSRDLMSISHPIMYELMLQAGETINLLVLDESHWQAVLIGQVQCSELMRMVAPIGGHLPLHASGGGKVFLADFNDQEVIKIIQQTGLTRLTTQTIDTQNELLEMLKQVRKQGYAFDYEEHALGLHCIAAPIYDEHQKILAVLSISGPKSRISNEKMIHLGSLVMQAAAKVSQAYSGV